MSDQLTLFAADSPVSLGAQPGSKAARKMTGTSGRRCSELSRISGLGGSLARMSEALFQTPWASTAVYLTWRPKATPAGRLLFQLAPSAPRTGGTGVGLWHTPQAHDKAPGKAERYGRHGTKHGGADLNDQVAAVEARLWPTPHGFSPDGKTNGPSGNELERAVNQSLWPTPKTPTGGGQMYRNTPGGGIRKLEDAVSLAVGYNTGSLNPTWVEWLMGFPSGWTDLKPSETP